MGEGDFLKRSAESSFCQNYVAGVTTCSLSTNSELLLETAGDTFQQEFRVGGEAAGRNAGDIVLAKAAFGASFEKVSFTHKQVQVERG
jgi:hypothetical protein